MHYIDTYYMHRTRQDGGVEGHLIYENSKTATNCRTTIDRRMLGPTKKRYPMFKGKGEAPTRW